MKFPSYEAWVEAATELYADELHYLESQGWVAASPTMTSGSCTALYARRGDISLLATDSDGALVRTHDDADSSEWSVAFYDDNTSDWIEDTTGEGPTLAEALQQSMAAYHAITAPTLKPGPR